LGNMCNSIYYAYSEAGSVMQVPLRNTCLLEYTGLLPVKGLFKLCHNHEEA
jgi:hypothetical protein